MTTWEKHGELLVLVANGWKRAVIMPEGRGYIGVGIFGAKLEERHDTNKRMLRRRMADQHRREFPLPLKRIA